MTNVKQISSMNGEDYADAVVECDAPQPCLYGHLGCALKAGGRCMDEALGRASIEDDDAVYYRADH